MSDSFPNVLIEKWLPFDAIGAESQRERGASSALPPLYFLHVWWARRPLTASRAAILASVLPQWRADWPANLQERFPTEESYHKWFVRFMGITGDPVAGRKLIQWAKNAGVKLDVHPYGGAPRAFTVNPDPDDLRLLQDLMEHTWGTRDVSVMDVTAGGGSIPFEALRYGFTTYANELNPVASVILKATLDYPARFGPSLADDIRKWGDIWAKRVEERLAPYFPKQPGENIFAYLWARTVSCPTTGKPVPLSPNWWLSRENGGIAAKPIVQSDWNEPRFLIQRGSAIDFNPDHGSVSNGIGLSLWTNEAIGGDYIKSEAQAGRMGQTLYAIALKRTGGFEFRAPTEADLEAVRRAETELEQRLPEWRSKNILPDEEIDTVSNYDRGHRLYGITRWSEFFSTRQLLAMVLSLEELNSLTRQEIISAHHEQKLAIGTYLAIALDKALSYNSSYSRFDPGRGIRNAFEQHNFRLKWTFSEFDASTNLMAWCVDQTVDSVRQIGLLSNTQQHSFWTHNANGQNEKLHISQGSATDLNHVADGIIYNITFDPPYYDNVMYAELSDFFYVWLKRSVGHLFPEFFQNMLTNKDDEAVANVARFADLGKSKKKLAEQDYERKMEAIFRECHRVLRDDGVLTIMFTHKQVEAWDTLAMALINAGFVVKASWPVHTESEHSLHQAKKNAAASTILLTCRKRQDSGEPIWWDDLRGQVRRVAREKAEEFAAQGIGGVDLYISTFGPVLSVISAQWPVLTSEVNPKTGDPLPLRPEVALDLAREEVIGLRKQGLLLGRNIDFDATTDWYLMAWDAFKAAEFPYDEARKLAIALGVDLDGDLRGHKNVVAKKSNSVVLQEPHQRRKHNMVDPDLDVFDTMLDAVHTALMVLQEDGSRACEVFLKRSGLMNDSVFKQCVQAMLFAIPRTRVKGKWARVEAGLLEDLRLNFYPDLDVPVDEAPPEVPQQMVLGWDASEALDEDALDDEDEET